MCVEAQVQSTDVVVCDPICNARCFDSVAFVEVLNPVAGRFLAEFPNFLIRN